MPLLTDPKRIADLREQFPTLTHTSWKELREIEPRPTVDKHHEDLGMAVCATSSDSDFYALRCNEQRGMINYSFPYRDTDGKINRIFIFEKMKDTYYEHVVSSKEFIPIVSKDSEEGIFSGEWAFQAKKPQKESDQPKDNSEKLQTIKPISVKVGHKEEVLKRTPALVFTIFDIKRFKELLNDNSFIEMIKDSSRSLEAVTKLVDLGILKRENKPDNLKILSEHSRYGKEVPQNASPKKEFSAVQQATILSQQSQH